MPKTSRALISTTTAPQFCRSANVPRIAEPALTTSLTIADPDGGPPRFHIVGVSFRDLLTAYRAAGELRRRHPEMTFVAGEMCIDG